MRWMKMGMALLLAGILTVLGMGMVVSAEESTVSDEGVFGVHGGLRWEWNEVTKTITISGDDVPNVTITSFIGDQGETVWKNDVFNEYVEYIRFDNLEFPTLIGNYIAK